MNSRPDCADDAERREEAGVPGAVALRTVRRGLADPDELAYYLPFALNNTSLAEIVRAIGARWTVEHVFHLAERHVGLDQCEAHFWTGWHRDATRAALVTSNAGHRALDRKRSLEAYATPSTDNSADVRA